MRKKNYPLLILLIAFLNVSAQTSGVFKTSFGEIKLIEEKNEANPSKNENVVYGDYRDLGTIVSTSIKGIDRQPGRIISGKFMNGNKAGSFEWGISAPRVNEKYTFRGKWGWGTSLNGGNWNGERTKFYQNENYHLKFAKWSGNWDTSFGKIFLKQHGNQVTGDYGTKGPIEGTITGNVLKGTFKNGNSLGYFEFKLDCNEFSGKWGWDKSLNKGKWDGTKVLKTNDCSSRTNSNSNAKDFRYRLTLDKIYIKSVDDGPEGIFAGYELFGIAWCRAYDSNGKQIKPFDVTYADQYGRFWEIKPKDYIKTDLSIGSQYEIGKQITFDFPINNINSIDDILKKSKIELTVELKDYDSASSVDVLGKERVVIPLNEATIPKRTQNYIPTSTSKGVINIKHGNGHIMVTYHIEKI